MFGNAEGYERFMGRWSRVVAPLLVDFAGVPESGRVLDVGSGTGSLAFAVAEAKSQTAVLGIDPSKEYVDYAASRNPFPGRVEFQVGDAQLLQCPDATFEASLSLLVFSFIRDREKALGEVCRVTRPGGVISAAVWDYGGEMRMLRAFWDAAASVDPSAETLDEKHMPLCRAGELKHLWIQAGLENVREEPIDIAMHFDSYPDYWDPFLLGQGPAGTYVRRIQHDRVQVVRGEVKRHLRIEREDMPFLLTARAWAVRGTARS